MSWTSTDGSRLARAMVACLTLALAAGPATGRQPRTSLLSLGLSYGPHPVGFRLEPVRDHSRRLGPAVDFEGQAATEPLDWPIQTALWYPADASAGQPMSHGDYRRLTAGVETLVEPPADDARVITDVRRFARMAFDRTLGDAEVQAVLAVPGHAVRDARPAPGPFPLIVGSLGDTSTAWTLAEYLASHGYVVVTAPSLGRTATAQAAQPAVALESQARTMEFLQALAHDRPYVDTSRIGLVGVNFDGATALLVQARGMQARAVVTIDGVEGKGHGAGILATSPWFDPVRVRVPYFTVQWDEPTLAPIDYTVFDRLRYAERRSFVIRDFGHLDLVGNLLPWPQIDEDTRSAYVVLYESIRAFVDTHVRGITRAAPVVAADRFRADRQAAALPPAPTPEELERVIWHRRDVDRGLALIRAARTANADARVIDNRTLLLYAFRFEQLGQSREAGALRALAAELDAREAPPR